MQFLPHVPSVEPPVARGVGCPPAAALLDGVDGDDDVKMASKNGHAVVEENVRTPPHCIRVGGSWSVWFLELPAKERNEALKEHCPNVSQLEIGIIRKEVQRMKQNAAQQRCAPGLLAV
jgi:hypothetical protein